MFARKNIAGKSLRKRVVIDTTKDKILVEKAHRDEVDINVIVGKYGNDIIQKTMLLNSPQYRFDEVPGNDFQEAMLIIAKAKTTFEQLPSAVRTEFENNPAKYVDYVQNPDNAQELIDRGWAIAPEPEPQPVQVEVINPETPEAEPA